MAMRTTATPASTCLTM